MAGVLIPPGRAGASAGGAVPDDVVVGDAMAGNAEPGDAIVGDAIVGDGAVGDGEVGDADIGVPASTAALALAWAEVIAARAEALTGVAHTVDTNRTLAHVLLPLLVGEHSPGMPPRPAPGGGFVHADVIDDDEPLFAAIVADNPQAGAEELAVLTQECRLPVAPYRAFGATAAAAARAIATAGPSPATTVAAERRLVPDQVTIVDLTAMWAGPLCSMLLAAWGARVVTVESAARPDGLRGAPGQFAALDHGKHRVDLDLRRLADRARFERLVAGADVVLESFSSRVMANFGYSPDELRRLNPRIATVSMRAFPTTSAAAGWVGYGRGAHAASGLGVLHGVPQPARFPYPDPIAGFAACATALDLLGRTEPPPSVEISLLEAIAPLTIAGERPLAAGDAALLGRLRTAVGTDPGSPIIPSR